MPNFPIVDTHLHIWDPGRISYPWLADIPLLNQPHLPADYRKACAPVEVEQMVFLQCEAEPAQFMEEVRWVTEQAQQDERITGMVPWAPLEKGDAAKADLEALAANPLVKGIRRIIQFEPDMTFCLQPDFVRGVQLLESFDFSFDICISHVHMANTIELVRRCPNVRFILDHIGKPDIKGGVVEPWMTEIRELAGIENVWCKMSGLVTEADHDAWRRKDLEPYIEHVIECFGVDRTVYGGDWPVSSQACDYSEWVYALEEALVGCSSAEQRKIFRENAIDFYRL